jgi:hypothetical protein
MPRLPAAVRPAVRPAARARVAGRGASYWALARAPRYSLVFALPLLVTYELLAAALGDAHGVGLRNGADVWLKTPFVALLGPRGPAAFGALVVGGATLLVWRDVRRARDGVRHGVLARMLAEAALLAVVCGAAVGAATAQLLRALPRGLAVAGVAGAGPPAAGAPAELMLSLGAGLYEELLFRVVLVGALGALARRALGLGPALAGAAAVLGGATLFALAHHVGAYGEPLALAPFTFRFVAGLFFSALYVLRGFGIAAWTHALYDVGVLVLGA